jgi:SMODS and SLOG-associating 2TM effector domain family 5
MSQENISNTDAYDKLKENVMTVMKNYYAASDRLNFHNVFSQWTLSFLSLGFIVIPVLTVTKIPLHYDQNVIDFASISLAVALLMLSLLIGINNYSARGERMYQAGLEFNDLIRKMRFFESNTDRMNQYKNFSRCYGIILQRYENVSEIDCVKAQININRQKNTSIHKTYAQFKYWCLFAREMIVYFVPVISEFWFIFLLVKG